MNETKTMYEPELYGLPTAVTVRETPKMWVREGGRKWPRQWKKDSGPLQRLYATEEEALAASETHLQARVTAAEKWASEKVIQAEIAQLREERRRYVAVERERLDYFYKTVKEKKEANHATS